MEIKGIDHLVITVRDLEVSLNFYTQVLGLELLDFGSGRKAVRCGQQKLNFHCYAGEF